MSKSEIQDLQVGQTFEATPRLMTRERMRWYCDALETATDADGTFKIADPTIHTDDEYARSQGLPGIIADGMISTNWISGLLVSQFGMDYVARGDLLTKFIRPVYEDELIKTFARVANLAHSPDGVIVELKVWCEKSSGEQCTVGTAFVPLSGQIARVTARAST